MPDEKTRADALRFSRTGADSDGGSQSNPVNSRGKYRSSSEATHLGATITNAISNVTVDFVGGANGTGDGTLAAKSADTLAWTAPGGSEGTAVTIANGETKILEDGGDADKYIRVSRTSADSLSGTATVTLADQFNNELGSDSVSSAELSTGDIEFYCIAMKNESASEVKDIKFWLGLRGTVAVLQSALAASGAITVSGTAADSFSDWDDSGHVKNPQRGWVHYYTKTDNQHLAVDDADRDVYGDASEASGVASDDLEPIPMLRIGKEAPTGDSSSGVFTDRTTGNEGTTVSGVTFATPTSAAHSDVIDVGDLLSTYIYGLWMEREIQASADAESSVINNLESSYDATI